MAVKNRIHRIRISVVERNSLIGFGEEIHGRPNPVLGCDGNEPRIVGRQQPILICLCADHDFGIEENRVNQADAVGESYVADGSKYFVGGGLNKRSDLGSPEVHNLLYTSRWHVSGCLGVSSKL